VKFSKVAMVLKDLRFKTETVDDEERKVVVATLAMDPFGKRLASTFVPGFVEKLFNGDAKPIGEIESISLALHAGELVKVDLRRAADNVRPTVSLTHVEVGASLRVKNEADERYSACFTASFRYPEAKDLLTLANGVACQFWVSLAPQQGSILDDGDE
jgi:hypothetical protein